MIRVLSYNKIDHLITSSRNVSIGHLRISLQPYPEWIHGSGMGLVDRCLVVAPLYPIRRRTLIAQGGVKTLAIIEHCNVPEQIQPSLCPRHITLRVSHFAFEGDPKAFDGAIIPAIPRSIHAHIDGRYEGLIDMAVVLCALIRIDRVAAVAQPTTSRPPGSWTPAMWRSHSVIAIVVMVSTHPCSTPL